MRKVLLLLVLALAASGAEKKHFLLTLNLTRPLDQLSPAQQQTLRQHGDYLNKLYLSGRIAAGGRTQDPARPIGLAVLEVDAEADARSIVAADPAVSAGLMKAELQPFFLAFPPPEPGVK